MTLKFLPLSRTFKTTLPRAKRSGDRGIWRSEPSTRQNSTGMRRRRRRRRRPVVLFVVRRRRRGCRSENARTKTFLSPPLRDRRDRTETMDSIILNKKMYLMDGSFISSVQPYVPDFDSVMQHPLWGSNLLFENEEAIIRGQKDYIRAGVEFLTTNTYQASIDGFKKHLNLNYEQSFQLIKKSVKICRRAIQEESSERNIRVLGSVGPYGATLCDGSEYNGNYIDNIDSKALYDWHKPRIQALVEAGVDVLLFETIPSIGEADILLNILTEFPNIKAFLSFSCKDGNHISHGETFSSAVEKFWSDNPQKQLIAIGMNCLHPKYITPLLMSVKTENVNFIVYPNGGGEWDAIQKCWDNTQEYSITVSDLTLWSEKGLKIFGGCCSTDANQISRFRHLIDALH